MSDLTGEDAFDRVLETAMEARNDARKANERVQEVEVNARLMERNANEANAKANKLERESKDALPKLTELWQAANDILPAGPPSAAVDRLRKALAATSDICDQIPF